MSTKSIAILGCGWLGLPLGKYLVEQGYRVAGSTTRAEKLSTIQAMGMEAFQIQDGAITIGCNNINVSYHGLQSTTFSSPKQDNFDLL